MVSNTNAKRAGTYSGAGIYIDLENLRNDAIAKNIIRYALETWDDKLPRITSISLYGKQTVVWQAAIDGLVADLQGQWPFANSQPKIRISTDEAYTRNPEKNSADIKLAMDACQDMLSGAVSFIAVLSNDSDFMALYEKVEELKKVSPPPGCPNLNLESKYNEVTFLIINHPANAGISASMKLVPDSHR